jgi:hypothetical protein
MAIEGSMSTHDREQRFVEALALAALDIRSDLPKPMRQALFERALVRGHPTERDEDLREQLAPFLQEHHERTTRRGAGPAAAV